MKRSRFSRRQLVFSGISAIVGAVVPSNFSGLAAAMPDAASDRLAFTVSGQEFHFNTGSLRGSLHKGGKPLGLQPVVDVASGTSLAGPHGLLSPYRLLTSEVRFGTAAWDRASRARLLADGAVFAAPNTLDFTATVKPGRQLHKFELFLASYFTNKGFSSSFAYVRNLPQAGGKPGFMEATKQAGHWLMFPRDRRAARLSTDGRWSYPPNPVAWKTMPQLAAPLAFRRDAKSGLTAVLMAPAEDCFAVSTPYGEDGHRSLYLSLFGRDLKSGETATAHARLVIGNAITDQQAVDLYEAYRKERK